MRLPLAEIGAERLFQAVAAGFGPASDLHIIPLPASGHEQAYTGPAFKVKCEGPSLHGLGRYGRVRAPLKGGRNAGLRRMFSWLSRRRSSVVERVIGNDEVLSSILSGGTIRSIGYGII